MKIEMILDSEFYIRIITIKGLLTYNDLRNKLQEIYSDPNLIPYQKSLWDLAQADVTTFTSEQINTIADFVSKSWGTNGQSRAALVVKQDVSFGLSRMYEILLSDKTLSVTKVFNDYEQALEWLKTGQEPASLNKEKIIS